MFVLKVTLVAGNIFDDPQLEKKFQSLSKEGACEMLKVTRSELEKNRLRKNTDKGSDVGILLDNGKKLRHGDVLVSDDKFILVEQLPEKVIAVKLNSTKPELQTLLGHIIGNRHRPISLDDGYVLFPIQADSELDAFKKIFVGIADNIELNIQERVFVPHKGMDVHEH